MNCNIRKLSITGAIAIFLATLLLHFAGCASSTKTVKGQLDTAESSEPKLITDISTTEDSESSTVLVSGDRLLTYTSVKQPFPLGVLLYFPETALDNIETTYTPDSDIVRSVQASEITDKGHTSRIEILLKKDASYEVAREDTGLKISFKKASAIAASATTEIEEEKPSDKLDISPAESIPVPASHFESILATQLENSVKISVNADGTIKEYKSFTVDKTPRIVFDIYNVISPYKGEQSVQVNTEWVKRVRHFGYPDRLRVVLDTKAEYLSAFSANPVEKGLVIHVGEVEATEVSTEAISEVQVTKGKPAWINRIDFASKDDGKSTIIIGTTTPVKYNLKKINDKKLLLNLFNTRLPDYRKRPLITTRFQSAVDRIMPFQSPAMKDSSLVSIELRESVPYFAEQTDDLLVLHFEASSIPPKRLDEAKLPSWKKAILQTTAEIEAPAPEAFEVSMPKERVPEERMFEEGVPEERVPEALEEKFTGEKIALNFYDTDIKNVFRILMNVSGKNFAIDKDVKGKVTLTLDKPVPWDQVLDLILKMNRLGVVYEGDIVRIATLKTLKAENAYKQTKFAADKKLIEQEKALEPLITEYIPISYADASGDVLPHIVLTEGRGSVTVDGRNNQIIITDTAEKVELAKETIKRIDKVTPQVIIEARIVEAQNTFSRQIGSYWGVTAGPNYDPGLDGNVSWDMSSTNPAPSIGEIGVQFTSLGSAAFELLDLRLQASESEGQIKIVSSPRVLTLDNTAASIKQGLAYPYNKLDADGNTVTEFKDIALQLDVTPHVTPDNRIAMKISVQNNEIGALINNQISFTTKEAQTELLVDDGDTIIIGGIRKTRKDNSESGVPGLRKLPVIGWLFKSKSKSDDLEELLIFITPRIVTLEQRLGKVS